MELWVTKYNDTTKFNNLIEIGSLFLTRFSESNPELSRQFGGMVFMDFLEKWMSKGSALSKIEKVYNSPTIRSNLPDTYLGFLGYAILVMRWAKDTESYIKEYIAYLSSQPQVIGGESQKVFQICQQYYNKLLTDQAKSVVASNRESVAKIIWSKLRFDTTPQSPDIFLKTSDFPQGINDIANQWIMKTHDPLIAGYRIANQWAGSFNQLDFFLSLHRNRANIARNKSYQEKIAKLEYFVWGNNKKNLIILENDRVLDYGLSRINKKYPKEFELCFLWTNGQLDWKLLESCMTPSITDMEINGEFLQKADIQWGTKKYNIQPYLRQNNVHWVNQEALLSEINQYILPEYDRLSEGLKQKNPEITKSELPEYFWFLNDLRTQTIIVSQYRSLQHFEICVAISASLPPYAIIHVENGVLNCVFLHNSVPIAEYESTKMRSQEAKDQDEKSIFYSWEPKIILSLKEQIRSFLIANKQSKNEEIPVHSFYDKLTAEEKEIFLHKAATWAFAFLLDTQARGDERFTRGDLIYNYFYTPTKKKYTTISDYIRSFEMLPIAYRPESSDTFVRRYLNLNRINEIELVPYDENDQIAFTSHIFWLKQKDRFHTIAQNFPADNLAKLKEYALVLEGKDFRVPFIHEMQSEELMKTLTKYEKNRYKSFKTILANIDLFRAEKVPKWCQEFLSSWLSNLDFSNVGNIIYGAYIQRQQLTYFPSEKNFEERLQRITSRELLWCFESYFIETNNIADTLANQEKCRYLIEKLQDMGESWKLLELSQFILEENFDKRSVWILSMLEEYGMHVNFDIYLAKIAFRDIEKIGKNIAVSQGLYSAIKRRFELEWSKIRLEHQKAKEIEKESIDLGKEKKNAGKKIKVERPSEIIIALEEIQKARETFARKTQSLRAERTALNEAIAKLRTKKIEQLTPNEQSNLQEHNAYMQKHSEQIASCEKKLNSLRIIGREQELKEMQKFYEILKEEQKQAERKRKKMMKFQEKDIPKEAQEEIKKHQKRINHIEQEIEAISTEAMGCLDQRKQIEKKYPTEGNQKRLAIAKREIEIQEYLKQYGSSETIKNQNKIFFDNVDKGRKSSDQQINEYIRSFHRVGKAPITYELKGNHARIYDEILSNVYTYFHTLSDSKGTYELNLERLSATYSYGQNNLVTALKCIEYLNEKKYMATEEWAKELLEVLIDTKEITLAKVLSENEDFFYFFLYKYGFIGKQASENLYITQYLQEKFNQAEIDNFVTQYKIKNIRRLKTKTSP
mgnify:CR=1 FL=1